MKLVTYCIGENEKVGVLNSIENSIYPMEAFGLQQSMCLGIQL